MAPLYVCLGCAGFSVKRALVWAWECFLFTVTLHPEPLVLACFKIRQLQVMLHQILRLIAVIAPPLFDIALAGRRAWGFRGLSSLVLVLI